MSYAYRVPGRSTTVTFLGFTEFAQCSAHRPAKSEYGLDAMLIDYIGAIYNLAKFLDTLKQGKRFDHQGRAWYLQTWSVDDNRIWPTVTMNCIGLAEGKFPKPKADDSYITQNMTVTATVTEDAEEIQVTREIDYRCLQTSWTYITDRRPTAAKIGRVSSDITPGIISSVIEANGKRYAGSNAPAAYVTATTPAVVDLVMDVNPREIPGTPYFEVEEVVSRILIAA